MTRGRRGPESASAGGRWRLPVAVWGALRRRAAAAVRLCGVGCLGDVAGVELVHRACMMPPDAGEAVRLQFHAHGNPVGFPLRDPSARRFDLLERAVEFLYVVAHLVGDYVRLREIARCTEARLQVAEEPEGGGGVLVAGGRERAGWRLW